jgi:serine/threonine protein kinase
MVPRGDRRIFPYLQGIPSQIRFDGVFLSFGVPVPESRESSRAVRIMVWLAEQNLHGDRYTIERILGGGCFGITYLARDSKNNRVAIKTLSDELLNELSPPEIDRLQEKLLQEAVKLTKCRHSHIVRVKEPFFEGEQVCIVMEYVDGEDLAHRAQKRLSEKEALGYIRQIGGALEAIHEAGVVHRDVKPANIVARGGKQNAVLIDFGFARGFNSPLTTVNPSNADGFDALETYQLNSHLGAATDVYSLAATLYFLLTGKEPPKAIDLSVGKAKLIPPKDINPEVSDRVNQAILEGMMPAPEKRPQSVEQWLALVGVRRAKVAMPWHNWNLTTWLAVIGTIVALLAVIGTLFALRPTAPPEPEEESPVLRSREPAVDSLIVKQ